MQYWGLDRLGGSRIVTSDFFKIEDGDAHFYRQVSSETPDTPAGYVLAGYIKDPVVVQEIVEAVPETRIVQGSVE